MSKQKILIVCNSEFAYQKFIEETYIELKKKYQVDILIGLEDDMKKNLRKKNIFYVYMPKSFLKFIIYMPLICFSILKRLKRNNYAAIIHNNRNASIYSRFSIFFLKKKIISIYFARGMYFHDNQNFIVYFLSYLLEVFLLLKTNLILSQTKEDIKKTKSFLKFLKIKNVYIGNGTDIIHKKKFDIRNNRFIAICRITKNKGLEDLLYAFSNIKKFDVGSYLTIIGGPRSKEDYEYLKSLKQKFDFSQVFFTGMVKDVKKYLIPGQVYILPSYREGLSRSLLEAMSCGLVPIVSNIRGSREVIINSKNGFIYNFADKRQLLDRMKKILSLKLNKKKLLVKNSIRTIKENFSKDNYIRKQILAIDNVLYSKFNKNN